MSSLLNRRYDWRRGAGAPGTVEAASEHVLLLLPRIRLVDEQQRRCKKDICHALDQLPQPQDDQPDPEQDDEGNTVEHRDVDIIRSLPGIGDLIAATVLSEASQPLISKQYHNLIPLGGVVPVTIKSGKKGKRRPRIIMRYACKTRLRNAIHHWGSGAIRLDPQAKAFYDSARSRGQGHAHALRVLGAK